MITTSTVFLTGAGASNEYGFPTGHELIELMLEELPNQIANLAKVKVYGFDWNERDPHHFYHKLRESRPRSIDTFIELNNHFRAIAQFSIARVLLDRENCELLIDKTDTYLQAIWYELIDGVKSIDDFLKNRISFVTFNYDRSLEFFFRTRINAYFHYSPPEKVVEALRSIRILHIFGFLDPIFDVRPYGKKESFIATCRDYFKISKDITLLHEASENFNDANELFQVASQIIIMGFGYEQTTFEKLRLNNLPTDKKIVSSDYGLRNYIGNKIKTYFKNNEIDFRFSRYGLFQLIQEELQ